MLVKDSKKYQQYKGTSLLNFRINYSRKKFYDTGPWNPHRRERLSEAHLLVLTSLDQLILKMKVLFTFVTEQAILMRRSTVLSLSLQLVFLVLTLH